MAIAHNGNDKNWLVSEIALIKRLWGNGGKNIIAATLILGASTIFSLSLIVYTILTLPEDFHPMNYPNPQRIIGSSTVPQGGTIEVAGTRCINSKNDIGVDARSYWRNLDTGKLTTNHAANGVTRVPGCVTQKFSNDIPIDLPPGNYHLEGSDTARQGNSTQTEGWHTEPFTVIPREQ